MYEFYYDCYCKRKREGICGLGVWWGLFAVMARRSKREGQDEKENCGFQGKRIMVMMWFDTSREGFVCCAGGYVLHEREHL